MATSYLRYIGLSENRYPIELKLLVIYIYTYVYHVIRVCYFETDFYPNRNNFYQVEILPQPPSQRHGPLSEALRKRWPWWAAGVGKNKRNEGP